MDYLLHYVYVDLMFVLFQNLLHNAVCKLRMNTPVAALHHLTNKESKKLCLPFPVRLKVFLRFLQICRKELVQNCNSSLFHPVTLSHVQDHPEQLGSVNEFRQGPEFASIPFLPQFAAVFSLPHFRRT